MISDSTDKIVANTTLPPGSFPTGLACDSAKGEVFIADEADDDVSVISDSTDKIVATVAVGVYPTGVVYDPAKGEVFVTNQGALPSRDFVINSSVSVISDNTNAVVATIVLTPGSKPSYAAYDPATGEIFVADTSNYQGLPGNVSVISDNTNAVVATVVIGSEPISASYDPATGEVFVTSAYANTVSVISDGTVALSGSTLSSTSFSSSHLTTSSSAASSASATTGASTSRSTTATTVPSSTTGQSSTTPSSTSTSTGGGVPEFPFQFALAAVFTVLLAASYLLVRHRTTLGGHPGQEASAGSWLRLTDAERIMTKLEP